MRHIIVRGVAAVGLLSRSTYIYIFIYLYIYIYIYIYMSAFTVKCKNITFIEACATIKRPYMLLLTWLYKQSSRVVFTHAISGHSFTLSFMLITLISILSEKFVFYISTVTTTITQWLGTQRIKIQSFTKTL